jgi:RNA polymerase sigma factor (TIGR02999 family)
MTREAQSDTKSLLVRWRAGDLQARDRLFELLYPDIEKAAAALLRSDPGVSFSARDLVHQVMVRLIRLNHIAWHDRSHFLALAARMMRRALIDHVRQKRALRRDHVRVELRTQLEGEPAIELDDIDFAISKLGEIDPIYAEIVEMRYFGGMSLPDMALVLECSESTVKRRWRVARAWLLDWMAGTQLSRRDCA